MITSIALVMFAGIAKAFMDASADGKLSPKLNKANSWMNKWKHGDKNLGEAFLGSSTIFVFLTDFWHAVQMVFLFLIVAAIVLYKPIVNPLIDFIILSVGLRVTFELIYRRFK